MVNTGKPSRGCYMCRTRRIKCDEAKPQCMRCQKSRRICPGYRDAFELTHRDETKLAKRKVPQEGPSCNSTSGMVLGNNGTPIAADPAHSFLTYNPISPRMDCNQSDGQTSQSYRNDDSASQEWFSQVALLKHLSTPLDQQAACYFLSDFVLLPQQGSTAKYFDFLVPLLKTAESNSPMDHTFSAVALAALGSRPNSKSLLPMAEYSYIKALKSINLALANPSTALEDATLASVILLSTFEQLVAPRKNNTGWVCHIDGAVALIKSRRKDQFTSYVGRALFLAVRAHMTVQCIARSRAITLGVDWWMNQIEEDEINRVVSKLNLKVAELRADAERTVRLVSRTATNIEEVLKLLQRSEALEQEYLDWQKSLPTPWKPNTVSWIDGAGNLADAVMHPGRIDSYSNIWVAYTHNIVRSCRLFVWTTLLRCVAWLGQPQDYRLTLEYIEASKVCHRLVEDVVASIPYFFGWSLNGNTPTITTAANFAYGSNGDNVPIKGVSGVFVMWPIFTAASSDFATPSQRLFLKQRLKTIHHTTGINQADILLRIMVPHPSTLILQQVEMNLPQPDYPPMQIQCKTGSLYASESNNSLSIATAISATNASREPQSVDDNGGVHDLDYLNDYQDGYTLDMGADYEFSSLVSV